eukprot:4886913-Pyramimonas_sp.AAC.1
MGRLSLRRNFIAGDLASRNHSSFYVSTLTPLCGCPVLSCPPFPPPPPPPHHHHPPPPPGGAEEPCGVPQTLCPGAAARGQGQ